MARYVLLFSGGIDSAAACMWATRQDWNVEALYVRKSVRQDPQRRAALSVANKLNICLHMLDSELPSSAFGSLISGVPVDEVRLYPDTRPFAELAVWLSVAASLAVGIGAKGIILGLTAENSREYPGVTKSLIESFALLIDKFTGINLQYHTPFIEWHKSDVLRYAIESGIILAETWSCENSGTHHCGICGHCFERRQAFKVIGVDDPTFYLFSQ